MSKLARNRTILITPILLIVVASIGLCSWFTNAQQHSRTEAEDYNLRLQQLGIPLTLEGVENYILQSVTIGVTREEVFQKLQPLGSVTSTNMGDCEGFAIGLENTPGAPTKPSDPMDQPPAFAISVCYSNGKISEVGNFTTLGSYFYTEGLYDGQLKPTVAARLTQTAMP